MALNLLAPDIQEALLNLPPETEGKPQIHEKGLRPIAAMTDWSDQRAAWRRLLAKNRESEAAPGGGARKIRSRNNREYRRSSANRKKIRDGVTRHVTARTFNTGATVAFASNWKLPARLDTPQDTPHELKLRKTMAAFNPKRLTNPDVIRSIEPGQLLEFLTPYQSYLHDRGLPLPAAGQAQTLDLDQLVDVLLTPSEHTPQDLLNAVYLIDELSTPQGMDALLAAARRAGMPFDEDQDHSPADIAVQVWLYDPTIVEDQHAWQAWKTPRKMECFQSLAPFQEPPIELTSQRIAQAEADCGDWLSHNNRSRNTKLFVRHVGRQIHFSLRRGDPFRREMAMTADGVEYLHFRPAKHDTIVFDLDEHELRINTPLKRALVVYCRVFGTLLFDDPGHFHNVPIYTLAPLAELGEDALSPGDEDRIESITLTQIRVDRGGPYNA